MLQFKKGMTLNDLLELGRTKPEYQQLCSGLALIDSTTQSFIKQIIEDSVDDVNNYYIKTEFQNQIYSLYLFNAEMGVTVGYSWPLATFLEKCSKKTVEVEMNVTIKKMLLKFNESKLSKDKINWII